MPFDQPIAYAQKVGELTNMLGAGHILVQRYGDILDGKRSKATQTEFVKTKPIPFPPEPFRFIGIQATRYSLDREDKTGKRNLWLRGLDRFGLGFDS